MSKHGVCVMSKHGICIMSKHVMCVISKHGMFVMSRHGMCVMSKHGMCVMSKHGMCIMSKHYLHLGKLKHLRKLLEAETAVVAAVGEEVGLQATLLQGKTAGTVSIDWQRRLSPICGMT